ncbi:MAG: hypothetical protein ABSF91_14100 [Bacteroidota bacterium]|jgi:hypothetical protein
MEIPSFPKSTEETSMKEIKRFFTVLVITLVVFSAVSGQIPRTISYQGVLKENGNFIDGTRNLRFALFASQSGQDSVWEKDTIGVQIVGGLFNVTLGPFDTLRFDRQYWLQVCVNNTPLSGRIQLASAGYSLNSLHAYTADSAENIRNFAIPDNSIDSSKIKDGTITSADIKDGTIQRADVAAKFKAPDADSADYVRNTTIPNNSIDSDKIINGSITTADLRDKAVTKDKIDTTGLRVAPIIALGSIDSSKLATSSVTNTKLSPDFKAPKAGYADSAGVAVPKPGSIDSSKLATGAVTSSKIKDGEINEADLATASVSNRTIQTDAVDSNKIKNGSITTADLRDKAVTVAKIDTTGLRMTPTIASNSIDSSKLASPAVSNSKIFDGAVTLTKLSHNNTFVDAGGGVVGIDGSQLTSVNASQLQGKIPGSGSGNIPTNDGTLNTNLNADKLDGNDASAFALTNHTHSASGDISGTVSGNLSINFPISKSLNNASTLLDLTNTSSGSAISGTSNGLVSGIVGSNNSTTTSPDNAGVRGESYGKGSAMSGMSFSTGRAGHFQISNSSNASDAIYATTNGTGSAGEFTITNSSNGDNAVYSETKGDGTAGYFLVSKNTNSNVALYGVHQGNGTAVYGASANGHGVVGVGGGVGNGIIAQAPAGSPTTSQRNIFVGITQGLGNEARIDNTGKAYFNNGTQNSGADFAESIEAIGHPLEYEPGDVLVISQSKNRTVEKSASAYSALVAGIYSTKPGVLATEHHIDDKLDNEIPLAIVGIVPCKLSAENGSIEIGDLLTTSNTPGYAMKATEPKIGTILGKALEPLSSGKGKIKVLVTLH